jgi:peroxiredoxin Q/BCP
MTKLEKGSKAPDFNLPDQSGILHSLNDYQGKWLLLYFYPKDNTPGCTKEACSFRDNFSLLKKKVEVVGVSGDSVKSHKNFADKYSLPFTLLSDSEKKVINDYGANNLIFAKRTSFLINPNGVIEKVYEKVDPSNHALEIFQDINN